ncbi:MAG: shikimate dehydrogenase [Croceibacterium sp.]
MIGDPIAQSKSPAIHNFWLGKLGIEGDYRRCLVRVGELGEYFSARARDPDWRGCNITMPHKIAALEFVHKHRDPSFPIEPINIAVPLRGQIEGVNSDTLGLLEPLNAILQGQPAPRGPAIVVGSGGVLFSAMWALSALGYAPIHIVMRDEAKMAVVTKDYRGVHARPMLIGSPLPLANLLVNATPLGMTGFPEFPLSLDSLSSDAIVFETIYSPLETALLREARARGLRTVDGLSMLIAQASAGFQAFFKAPAPREHDAELRALLTS